MLLLKNKAQEGKVCRNQKLHRIADWIVTVVRIKSRADAADVLRRRENHFTATAT